MIWKLYLSLRKTSGSQAWGEGVNARLRALSLREEDAPDQIDIEKSQEYLPNP